MVRVSTIIPIYNGEATIRAAIDSALTQEFDGQEVIVVNDGSTDGTRRILESYGSRIILLEQANRGVAPARNTGAAAAQGEYLAFLDADDTWVPEKLATLCAALDHDREAALAFSDFRRVLSNGEQFDVCRFGSAPSMEDMLRRRSAIVPSLVVMRKSIFQLCGGFCEAFRYNYFEDQLMWVFAREHGEFTHVPSIFVHYLMHPRTPDEEYIFNGEVFASLIRKHYGRRAAPLIRDIYDHLGRLALQDMIRLIDRGDRSAALTALRRVARLRPALFFDRDVRAAFLKKRNLLRLLGTS